MSISIRNEKVDRETFDRLYSDAYNYSEAERNRLGDEGLKESMWNLHNSPENIPLTYFKDNNVVGCASVKAIPHEGKPFLLQSYVLLGRDNDGSRAWFYSAEFKEEIDGIITALNAVGLLLIRSDTSPVGIASKAVLPFELIPSKEIRDTPERFPANAVFSIYRKVT
jgi:hypothetical protein